jgi:probable DNA metabolism protein
MTAPANNRPNVTVIFDGSFEGFLCVVYAYYYDKINPIIIQNEQGAQLTLESEMYHIITNNNKSARVLKGIRDKISIDAAYKIYYAFLSGEEDKFMPIFRYVQLGFKVGHMVDSHLQEECVRTVHKLARHVGREAHLLYGFCRFAEADNGVFYCKVTPKNDVLALLANHFSQRFMNQAWVIHDKSRNQAAIYDGNSYIITFVPPQATVNYAEGEEETQKLWSTFAILGEKRCILVLQWTTFSILGVRST